MQVHQFHPTLSFGDAIGNQVLSVQRLLRRLGHRSEIFCEHLPDHFQGRAASLDRYARTSAPENVLLVHFSLVYSRQVMAWLRELPDRKVLVYHNVTPHTYFAGVNTVMAESAREGREQLGEVLALVEAAWGDSRYNCDELAEQGAGRADVLPIVFDPTRHAARPDRRILRRCRGGVNVLFVGRMAPHKRIEDLILTFAHLQRHVRADSRLLLVGTKHGMDVYVAYLEALVEELGLRDVVFAGHVSRAQLAAYYRCASVYLSMSEHEGFGAPLLESMFYGVPIVAYRAAAVPETLGGSGILIRKKDYAAVAEVIGLLVEETDLRERVVAGQRERLRDFVPERAEERLRGLLCELGAHHLG
jgi:glycosyltransferase involved in cell wall biosynthesis